MHRAWVGLDSSCAAALRRRTKVQLSPPKQAAAAERLSLSFGTYRRPLTSALDRLAKCLWERARAAPIRPPRLSIVVLPFANLGEDASHSSAPSLSIATSRTRMRTQVRASSRTDAEHSGDESEMRDRSPRAGKRLRAHRSHGEAAQACALGRRTAFASSTGAAAGRRSARSLN